MNRMFLVKVGKTFLFPYNTTTVAAFDTYEEANDYISKNLKLYAPKHMYIEPVEKITSKDFQDMFKRYTAIPMKGVI